LKNAESLAEQQDQGQDGPLSLTFVNFGKYFLLYIIHLIFNYIASFIAF